MLIDYIVILFIAVAAIFGFIRGIVSQIMAILGLIVAYLWSSSIGSFFGGYIQDRFDLFKFMADKIATFAAGIGIYIAARIVGFFINRLFSENIEGYVKINRLGGATFGAAKGALMVIAVFCFIALIPTELVETWLPTLFKSHTYQLAAKYNPMGSQKFLERMRDFREILNNRSQKRKLVKDPELKKILKNHDLENALRDKEFLKNLEEGDYEQLQKIENMEKLMDDDKMENLIDKLSKEGG